MANQSKPNSFNVSSKNILIGLAYFVGGLIYVVFVIDWITAIQMPLISKMLISFAVLYTLIEVCVTFALIIDSIFSKLRR